MSKILAWGSVDVDELSTEYISPVVFPNPIHDMLNVHFSIPHYQPCRFILYSSDGRMAEEIWAHRVKSGDNISSFKVAHLNPGVYFLTIEGLKGYYNTHIFIRQ